MIRLAGGGLSCTGSSLLAVSQFNNMPFSQGWDRDARSVSGRPYSKVSVRH